MTDPADEHGRLTEVPVACTLGADDASTRLQRWQQLHLAADPVARVTAGELEVRYRSGSEVLGELRVLVIQERVCCAFVSWVITQEQGQPVLRVSAAADSPEDVEAIVAMLPALGVEARRGEGQAGGQPDSDR